MSKIKLEIDMSAVGETIKEEILRQLKENKSVISGDLMDSFKVVVIGENEVEISSDIVYASYVNDKKKYIFKDKIVNKITQNIRSI